MKLAENFNSLRVLLKPGEFAIVKNITLNYFNSLRVLLKL